MECIMEIWNIGCELGLRMLRYFKDCRVWSLCLIDWPSIFPYTTSIIIMVILKKEINKRSNYTLVPCGFRFTQKHKQNKHNLTTLTFSLSIITKP